MKISIKDFFSKCDQIRRKLRIWSHLLKKSLMENFNFCTVYVEPKCRPKVSQVDFFVLEFLLLFVRLNGETHEWMNKIELTKVQDNTETTNDISSQIYGNIQWGHGLLHMGQGIQEWTK